MRGTRRVGQALRAAWPYIAAAGGASAVSTAVTYQFMRQEEQLKEQELLQRTQDLRDAQQTAPPLPTEEQVRREIAETAKKAVEEALQSQTAGDNVASPPRENVPISIPFSPEEKMLILQYIAQAKHEMKWQCTCLKKYSKEVWFSSQAGQKGLEEYKNRFQQIYDKLQQQLESIGANIPQDVDEVFNIAQGIPTLAKHSSTYQEQWIAFLEEKLRLLELCTTWDTRAIIEDKWSIAGYAFLGNNSVEGHSSETNKHNIRRGFSLIEAIANGNHALALSAMHDNLSSNIINLAFIIFINSRSSQTTIVRNSNEECHDSIELFQKLLEHCNFTGIDPMGKTIRALNDIPCLKSGVDFGNSFSTSDPDLIPPDFLTTSLEKLNSLDQNASFLQMAANSNKINDPVLASRVEQLDRQGPQETGRGI